MATATASRIETELERATERAIAHGIEVVGHGRRKSDGARIYCTTSHSDSTRWHIVARIGKRLICDCASRVICAHRASVYMDLVVAARLRELDAERLGERLVRDVADGHGTPEHPILADDTRGISIFK